MSRFTVKCVDNYAVDCGENINDLFKKMFNLSCIQKKSSYFFAANTKLHIYSLCENYCERILCVICLNIQKIRRKLCLKHFKMNFCRLVKMEVNKMSNL